MHRGIKALVKLLLAGPYIAVPRGYCNPYATCAFSNGTVRWVWISSSSYPSLGIGSLQGLLIDMTTGNVYRGHVIYPLGDGDDRLRFYRGPLILREAPLGLAPLPSSRGLYRFKCRCGESFEGGERELIRHLTERHAGLERPSRIEIEAYLQSSRATAI